MTRFESIGPERSDEALEFCRSLPAQAVFLAGWIFDGGLRGSPIAPKGWLMAERARDSRLVGLCYLSATGILMPVMSQSSSIEHLYAMARSNPGLIRVIVGERALVTGLWNRLGGLGLMARLSRDQLVYAVDRERFRADPEPLPLTEAREEHLPQLIEASAAMAREEAQDDPQARNPTLFQERIRARIARRRDFVHVKGDLLVFKGNVSALCDVGGQLEGVYTLPAHRRQGYARKGTSALTSWILERSPRAFLLVNDDNAPARALYESLGYQSQVRSRTIFVAP